MASRSERRAFWRRHVETFEASGQTRAAYCAAHGLNRYTLDDWRRRLRRACGRSVVKRQRAFVPLQVKPAAERDRAAAVLHTLRWPSGIELSMPRDCDPAWLAQVLSGLR